MRSFLYLVLIVVTGCTSAAPIVSGSSRQNQTYVLEVRAAGPSSTVQNLIAAISDKAVVTSLNTNTTMGLWDRTEVYLKCECPSLMQLQLVSSECNKCPGIIEMKHYQLQ